MTRAFLVYQQSQIITVLCTKFRSEYLNVDGDELMQSIMFITVIIIVIIISIFIFKISHYDDLMLAWSIPIILRVD